jgi:hypothetical protein
LRKRRTDVLPDFDLAGVNGNGAILADVKPRSDVLGAAATAAATTSTAGFLRKRALDEEHDYNACANRFEKIAATDSESIRGPRIQLVTLGLEAWFDPAPIFRNLG